MKQTNKTIILGVTGGIAIHKSIDLASQLVKQGHSVHVVMTENATRLGAADPISGHLPKPCPA